MHQETLIELVRTGQYPVEPQAVAEAILSRAILRQMIPGLSFRSDGLPPHEGERHAA